MILSNASPLITLVKVQKLEILKHLFGKVFIPEEVYEETVTNEKDLNKRQQIIKAIDEGFIEVLRTEKHHSFRRQSLGLGEQGVLRLALEKKPLRIIVDDTEARKEAKQLGFERTLTFTSDVLKLAAEDGLISYDDIMQTLRELGENLPEG